ncbi:MAG: sugar ABC transporter permease, partial [Clostridia bacterium]|nr:sugar ABC transporter permease [Clostridia bacterium]
NAEYNTRYESAVSAKLEELKASAGANADEAALMAEAKAIVDADTETLKTLKKDADDVAIAWLRSEYGIKSYNSGNGYVEIPTASFDLAKYNYYSADSVSYRGCAYVESESKYYIATEGYTLIEVDAKQAFRTDGASIRRVKHTQVEGITLPLRPLDMGNAMSYNEDENVAYVLYMNSNMITRIDFNEMEITYTAAEQFNIRSIIHCSSGDRIYYLYTNPYEADSGAMLLRRSDIAGKASEPFLKVLLTIFIVIAVLAGITLLFAMLCWCVKGYSEKFMDVMRGFKKNWAIYAIIAGSMVLVAMFCYYPAIASIGLSFFDYTDKSPMKLWNNFAHYKHIFTADGAWSEFSNMFLFLASDLFTALLPPLIFAFFLTIMRNKSYSAITRTLLFIPGIIPGVATTLIWKTGIYGTYGVLNTVIRMLNGETVEFLTQTATAKWSLIMMGFPFVGSYLIFYGAMMNVPDSYYEAAELDGITVVKRFVFIDVPLIFAQIKYVLIMTFIASVQNFGRTYMTTAGSWDTMTPVHTMYLNVSVNGNYGRASAYATVLFVFLFVATAINMRMQSKDGEGV